MNTSNSKKNINVTGSDIGSPHSELGRTSGENWGELQWGELKSGENLVEKCRRLVSNGWCLRVKRRKNTVYIAARKTENGKRREIYVSKVSPEEIEKLKQLGLLHKKTTKKATKKLSHKEKAHTTTSTTTRQQQREVAGHEPAERYGGSSASPKPGFSPLSFMVHRLGLRFVRPWVSSLFLHQFGGVRFVERSKQWVLKLGVGVKRFLTVQVNRDGSAQVFLEASDNPLTVEEFVGFCRFFLPMLFGRLTGRSVSLGDFVVMASPEVNVDLPGVNVLEGVGVNGKSLTLQEYYDRLVRIYWSPPGEKETMPEGGTRIEARAGEWRNRSLQEIVDAVSSMAKLPIALVEIKKELETIKSSLPMGAIEANELAEVVATKLANLIHLIFEKWGGRFELALRELGSRLQEALKPVFERLEQLERENRELRRRLQELQKDEGNVKFEDLPGDLKEFLRELEREGYVRLSETRISYGDLVWAAIVKHKGNIDRWVREESLGFPGRKEELFRAVISAIRFYDNKYNGKPGVPYSLFLGALKMYMNES